jgi:hypothetical protein
MSELPRITVDFSNQGEDDLVFARLARASQPLEQGDYVLAVDGEGNACYGYVSRVGNGVVYLDLDWETWVDEDSPTRTGVWSGEMIRELFGPSDGNGSAVAESERTAGATPAVLV